MMRHSRSHFFKYTSANIAKLILQNRKVRYSKPKLFNDPFDTQVDLRFPFKPNELRDRILQRIVEAANRPTPIPDADSHPHTSALELLRQEQTRANFSDELLIDSFRDAVNEGIQNQIDGLPNFYAGLRDKFLNNVKVFCVSEIFDDLLMWSHYSGNHTGVVIQFRALQELDNRLCAATPIIYQEEMPILASIDEWIDAAFGFTQLDAQKMWTKMFSIKHIGWSYEKEWRVIVPTEESPLDYEDTSIYPDEIGEIIFGCRIREDDRDEILNLLETDLRHVRVTQAKKSQTFFKLDFERLKN